MLINSIFKSCLSTVVILYRSRVITVVEYLQTEDALKNNTGCLPQIKETWMRPFGTIRASFRAYLRIRRRLRHVLGKCSNFPFGFKMHFLFIYLLCMYLIKISNVIFNYYNLLVFKTEPKLFMVRRQSCFSKRNVIRKVVNKHLLLIINNKRESRGH